MGFCAQVDLVEDRAFVTSEAFMRVAAIEHGYVARLQELGLHTHMGNAGHVDLSGGIRAYSITSREIVPSSMTGTITFRLALDCAETETTLYGCRVVIHEHTSCSASSSCRTKASPSRTAALDR